MLRLSVEVLQEIGSQIDIVKADHKNLRSVCKYLALAFDPLFFSSLVLRTHELQLEEGFSFLETLATGTTGWSRFARTLSIDPDKVTPGGGASLPNIELQDVLSSALGSMKNIQIVTWIIRSECPEWPRGAIASFLNSHPALDELQLDVQGLMDLNFSLDRLSGFRKLRVTSSLYKAPPTILRQMSQLISKNHTLSSLHLHCPADWSEIWTLLRNERIYLKDLATNVTCDDLLVYLASYSGIERIHLQFRYSDSDIESDRLANIFFDTVLPRHATSLMQLSCLASYEGRWSFGTHNAEAISRLQRLSRLVMSVKCEDVPERAGTASLSGENSVERLLHLAAQLPALHYLGIATADCPGNREAECGGPSMQHDEDVSRNILTVMDDFRPCASSPAVVAAIGTYELEPSSSDPDIPFTYVRRKNYWSDYF
ncbi:hypothetical protein C8R44DRAFT_867376 [Mycena epipterygia]|nr:hypothetical protein C8R44DRAFT_867376 [Mycena epipterygia]